MILFNKKLHRLQNLPEAGSGRLLILTFVLLSLLAFGSSATVAANEVKGQSEFQQFCSACHEQGSRLAPPVGQVSLHLNSAFDQFERAQVFIRDYVQSPDQNKALMPGAVQRFGLMPALPLPDEVLNKVSHYFWNYAERNNWQPRRGQGQDRSIM